MRASLLLVVSIAACAPVPRLTTAPVLRAPSQLLLPQNGSWPADAWWQAMGDVKLNGLIAEGLAGSPDVAVAAARVASAEALAQQAGAALGPRFTIDGAVGGAQQSKNLGIPPQFVPPGIQDTGRLTASVTFDLDLWGRNRAQLRAARGEVAAAQVDAAQTRLMLTTAIATAYAELAQYYDQRDVAVKAVDIRQATATLTAKRVQVGSETRGGQAQAEARVPQARADVTALDEAIMLTRHRLAALVGAGPDRGDTIARPSLIVMPLGVPANVGIDLVGRRPDLVAARLRAEAAGDRIRVARADFYPNIGLSALAGLQSLGLGNLFAGGSTYGNGGLAASLPIFDAGRIQGRYRGARADYDSAVARYDSILLTALREVADAVVSRSSADARITNLRLALRSAEYARQVADLRYRGGLSNQLPVLTADDTVLALRRAVTDLEARRTALDIALIRALGGGYRTPTSQGAS